MSETRGMSRRDKLKFEAKERRTKGKSKLKISLDAFSPEVMYGSEMEDREAWREAGVLDCIENTIGGDSDGW